MKTGFILSPLPLVLSGCSGGPDMSPIGGGLAVIGLAIVAAAVIRTMAGKGGDHE